MAAKTMAQSEGSKSETVISFEARLQIQSEQDGKPRTSKAASLVRFEKCVSKGRKSDGRAADFARFGMVLQRVLQPILRQFLHVPRNWVLRRAQTGG
jgi:hypothetical protein